jgi:hypothetical protein
LRIRSGEHHGCCLSSGNERLEGGIAVEVVVLSKVHEIGIRPARSSTSASAASHEQAAPTSSAGSPDLSNPGPGRRQFQHLTRGLHQLETFGTKRAVVENATTCRLRRRRAAT